MATDEDNDLSDELDYHITFPSPYSQGAEEDDDEEAVVLGYPSSPDKEPVVVLLGWLGCQDKHLQKYSNIYDQRRSGLTCKQS